MSRIYCKRAGRLVYSCDHAYCNGYHPKEEQGMKYCVKEKKYVNSCNHSECQK